MILARTPARGLGLAQRTAEIDPVERQNDVGLADELARRLGKNIERRQMMRGMVGREHRALLEIRHHAGAEALGEIDARLPEFRPARPAPEHDDRPLGARQQRRGLLDRAFRRP